MLNLRAKSSLLMACDADSPELHLKMAERDARTIRRERMPWAVPISQLIHAAVAYRRNREALAIDLLNQAVLGFETTEVELCAHAARLRLGELLGGDAGRQMVEKATQWMEKEGVRNVEKMARLFAPGFDRKG
jgi:hypothetical protein